MVSQRPKNRISQLMTTIAEDTPLIRNSNVINRQSDSSGGDIITIDTFNESDWYHDELWQPGDLLYVSDEYFNEVFPGHSGEWRRLIATNSGKSLIVSQLAFLKKHGVSKEDLDFLEKIYLENEKAIDRARENEREERNRRVCFYL
eukprot:TRINITY_DN1759_c0_g1_i1.p1 TRINITY_DN1759_c0_g1~~TRINITY_DN1759_c0_g1_i1.p1  ORF type:complete len:146 (-),score=35.38 TRINITY_DN1759_c0_g1_i1:237-674(-)